MGASVELVQIWKRKAEQYLVDSGIPYTIIRCLGRPLVQHSSTTVQDYRVLQYSITASCRIRHAGTVRHTCDMRATGSLPLLSALAVGWA